MGRAANDRPGERGTEVASKPSCSASCRHPMRRSNSETEWSLAWRVARVATSAALGPDVPFLRMCSVMAARRLLNRARTSAGTPTMSPVPSPDSSKLTPSLSTRPRRRRAWYTAVAALAWANRPALSMPVHRPSGPGVALATRTWVCSWGSPARLVWWTKAAATIPPPASKRTPRPWMPPRRTRQAWRLQVLDGSCHRRVVGGDHRPHVVAVAQGVQDRHRLGGGEGGVVAGAEHPAVAQVAAVGPSAGEQGPQVVSIDGPRQAERLGAAPQPAAGHLAPAQVVLLGAEGDGLDVVAGGVGRPQREDAQHVELGPHRPRNLASRGAGRPVAPLGVPGCARSAGRFRRWWRAVRRPGPVRVGPSGC